MQERKQAALENLRVLDFGAVGVGPICAMILGHFGAQVIKIESQVRPDPLRSAAPIKPGREQTELNASGYFNNFNSNKLSLTLDMSNEAARAVALDLVAVSDVVVENFKPGVLEKWGLGYDRLLEVNPNIIMTRLPMAGSTGPHRSFGGYGRVITPVAGLHYLSGFPDRPPVGIGTNYADFVVNPGHGAVGALAALHYRNRTGQGQEVEVAQTESTAAVVGPAMMDFAVNEHIPNRMGNLSDYAVPHGAFPCAGEERWLVIAVSTEAEWQALCQLCQRPDWLQDSRFQDFPSRKLNERALEQELSEWTRSQVAEEAMARLQSVGVAAGVVQNAQDMLERDPHIRERQYYRQLEHPVTGKCAYDSAGVRLSLTPGEVRKPAPLLGADNEYVLKDVLNYSDEQVVELLVAGAVQ